MLLVKASKLGSFCLFLVCFGVNFKYHDDFKQSVSWVEMNFAVSFLFSLLVSYKDDQNVYDIT